MLARGIERGFVERDGEALELTPTGREEAEALLSPWRRGGG